MRRVAARKDVPGAAREYALTALMKLSARLPDINASIQVSITALSGRGGCTSGHDVGLGASAGCTARRGCSRT